MLGRLRDGATTGSPLASRPSVSAPEPVLGKAGQWPSVAGRGRVHSPHGRHADCGDARAELCRSRIRRARVAQAAYILRGNSTGLITKAAPTLYPHQWSWDAAFNAIGLATVDLPRARLELDSLFAGQWRNGMVPHIVFDPISDGYRPGPAEWECTRFSEDTPACPATSGICDPPMHAIAVDRILAVAASAGAYERELTQGWAAHLYPKLLAWHRFLARDRTDKPTGLLTLFHGWPGRRR